MFFEWSIAVSTHELVSDQNFLVFYLTFSSYVNFQIQETFYSATRKQNISLTKHHFATSKFKLFSNIFYSTDLEYKDG